MWFFSCGLGGGCLKLVLTWWVCWFDGGYDCVLLLLVGLCRVCVVFCGGFARFSSLGVYMLFVWVGLVVYFGSLFVSAGLVGLRVCGFVYFAFRVGW